MNMPQEPQQSPPYKEYMTSLRWQVVSIASVNIFVKSFPFRQGIIKIHRPAHLPDPDKLLELAHAFHVRTLVLEPVASQDAKELAHWKDAVSSKLIVSSTPFLPTKTIRVDVSRAEKIIFGQLSEAKRRAVRRATALGVTITQSQNMNDLIRIKNTSAGWLGFITTTGMRPLWDFFSPDNASILLAHDKKNMLVGGVLLLHWDCVTYYWIAGATKHGKKLFTPTLLAWEAIRLAKQKKTKLFDFVGVWDERIPKQNTDWKGFTKFKEGFGGIPLYYPLVSER